jgi:AcrR family transcriptional regulator
VTSPTDLRASLRDEQTELTRARILDAIVSILARNVADLSVEAVARESGISRPTIYRYFRNKRAMVEAVGLEYANRLGTADAYRTGDLDEALAHLPAIFARWDALGPEMKAAAMAPNTRTMLPDQLEGRLADTRRILGPHVGEMPEPDRERLVRAVMILMSSGALDLVNRYLDASSGEAADLVTWMIRRLIGRGQEESQ